MNLLSKFVFTTSALALLSACSPIDSVKPFQGEQITAYLNQNRDIKPAQQMVILSLPQRADWKKIDMSSDNKGRPVIIIPIDETPHDWTESIQTKITGYSGHPDINAKKWVAGEFTLASKQCQHAYGDVLSQTRQATIYQLTMTGCEKGKNLVTVGKALNGADGVYVVYYTAVAPDISRRQIAVMSHAIEAAQLTRA